MVARTFVAYRSCLVTLRCRRRRFTRTFRWTACVTATARPIPGPDRGTTDARGGTRVTANSGKLDELVDPIAADDPVAANEAALRSLWEKFKATGDSGTRERLILHYSPRV